MKTGSGRKEGERGELGAPGRRSSREVRSLLCALLAAAVRSEHLASWRLAPLPFFPALSCSAQQSAPGGRSLSASQCASPSPS